MTGDAENDAKILARIFTKPEVETTPEPSAEGRAAFNTQLRDGIEAKQAREARHFNPTPTKPEPKGHNGFNQILRGAASKRGRR